MTQELDLAPKRTRESCSKVRTGCSTCKARRVKCDEGRPICQRCTIGGRNCEYTTARAAPARNVVTIYLPPAQIQPLFFVNSSGLKFFHLELAAKLDGQYDSEFWGKLVLQLSHSEPAVRHAVSAISISYRDVESSLRNPAGYVDANPEAQKDWNIAVKSLSARIKADTNSSLVPLVCCLLFTCTEFLRGSVDSAMLHAQSGFNILAAFRRNGDEGLRTGSDQIPNDIQAVEDHIVPMFSRLSVLCSLAGKKTPPIYATTMKEHSPHESLADSRLRLFELSDTCVRFIHECIPKAAMFQIEFDDLVEQIKLQTKLDAWRNQLDKLIQRMQAAGDSLKLDALHLLLVHYKVIHIWIQVCTTAGETATDSYYADFDELVSHAEQVSKSSLGKTTPQPLSFDIQILAPLYYTALKCRHPTIRRRALNMLQLAPRREALWNARHAYVTAKRIIELEERNLNEQGFPDETGRLHGLPLPDDESRIYDSVEMPVDFRKFGHSIIPSPTYPGTLEAVFQTKPWGQSGDFHIFTEYIKL